MPRRLPCRSTSAAVRKVRYRKRLRDGKLVLPIEIDHRIVDWLGHRPRWLERREVYQRCEIERLAAAARG
jgi:hypothetical protein